MCVHVFKRWVRAMASPQPSIDRLCNALRAVRADLPLLYGEDERSPFGRHKILRAMGREGRGTTLAASEL